MRPVPKPKYLLTAAIFVAVAAAYAALAFQDYRLGTSQIYMSAAALKHHDPSLYPCDSLFGQGDIWRSYTPVVQRFMDLFLSPTGYEDLYLPFRCLVAVATLIYLAGMYALLKRQCLSWSASAFTAVMSSAVLYTVGRSYWGVGSLASITPWTLAMIFSPALMLLYLSRMHEWRRLLLVFFLIGLAGNLHLVMAANLALTLALAFLGQNRFTAKAWARAAALAGLALAGALPSIIYYSILRTSVGGGSTPSAAVGAQALRIADLGVLYPELLKNLLLWMLALVGLMWVPVLALLSRSQRFRVRDLRTWAWFTAGAAAVGLVLHGLSQVAGIAMNAPPPVIDFVQACTLLMLPVFVLFAQATVSLFRLFRAHRPLLGCAAGVLLAAWMLPSENLRGIRYGVMDTVTMYMPEPERPRGAQRHHENFNKFHELVAIGSYARLNTDRRAVFVTDLSEFRMWGRRSVVACPDDVKYMYYLASGRLEDWLKLVHRQRGLLHPPNGRADLAALAAFIDQLSRQEPFTGASQWFVILDTDESPDTPGAFEIVTQGNWGQHYRLYRLKSPAASQPATKGS